jgi:hypothetical protein
MQYDSEKTHEVFSKRQDELDKVMGRSLLTKPVWGLTHVVQTHKCTDTQYTQYTQDEICE